MLEQKKEYYKNTEVLFEIVKLLRGRETAIRSPSEKLTWRCMKIHNMEFLKSNFHRFDFDKHLFNIYYSLAHVKDMPLFSYNLAKRKDQQKQFNQSFLEYYNGYDIGIDFDTHQVNEKFEKEHLPLYLVHKDVQEFKELLDLYNVPYNLKFSGSGFHINIPNEALEGIDEKTHIAKTLVNDLYNVFNLKTIDTSTTDVRRIWKVPYSFDVKTGNIALPLDNEQFENFFPEMVLPKNVLKLDIRNRGELTRLGKNNAFKELLEEEFDLK